jgi:hypothetical protein
MTTPPPIPPPKNGASTAFEPFAFKSRYVYRDTGGFLCHLPPAYNVGWKLHVVKPSSLTTNSRLPKDYQNLLGALRARHIPHKIVGDLGALTQMEKNPLQVGKFITIYPEAEEELISVLDLINNCIDKDAMSFTTAPKDLPVSCKGIVGARWGGLTSAYTVNAQNELVDDDRSRSHPDWIRNPFDPASRGADGWVVFRDDQKMQVLARDFKTGGVREFGGEISREASYQSE